MCIGSGGGVDSRTGNLLIGILITKLLPVYRCNCKHRSNILSFVKLVLTTGSVYCRAVSLTRNIPFQCIRTWQYFRRLDVRIGHKGWTDNQHVMILQQGSDMRLCGIIRYDGHFEVISRFIRLPLLFIVCRIRGQVDLDDSGIRPQQVSQSVCNTQGIRILPFECHYYIGQVIIYLQ